MHDFLPLEVHINHKGLGASLHVVHALVQPGTQVQLLVDNTTVIY